MNRGKLVYLAVAVIAFAAIAVLYAFAEGTFNPVAQMMLVEVVEGPQTSVGLRTADGIALTIVVPSHSLPRDLATGDAVTVSVREDNLWLIPA